MKKVITMFFLFVNIFILIGCGKAPVISGLSDYYIVYEGETSEPIFFKITGAPEHHVDIQSLSLNLEIKDNKLIGLEAGPAEVLVRVRNSNIKLTIPVYILSPYNYIYHSNGVTISKYLGSENETLVIPEKVYVSGENGYEYKTVIGISDYFYEENELEFKSITLPKTIESIGKYAFANNDTLEEVVIPSNIKLTEFSEGVFSNLSNLTTIYIPNKLLYISENALKDTPVTNFIIEDNDFYKYNNNLLINYNTSLDKGIIIYANPLSSEFVVPDDVELINSQVFLNHKNIKSIDLKNVKFIGMEAFKNSTLETFNSNYDFDFEKDAFLNTPYYNNLG